MTFNGQTWGYVNSVYTEPYSYSAQQILGMLQKCVRYGGNLLLNIGPMADGAIPREVIDPLTRVGKWLGENGEAVYGVPRSERSAGGNGLTLSTQKGNTVYLWFKLWPGCKDMAIGCYLTPPKRVTLLSTGEEIHFEPQDQRIVFHDLPEQSPDPHTGIAVFKMEFEDTPQYRYATRYPQLHEGERFQI